MTQVVNHKGKRLKVGPRGGGGVTIFIYICAHVIVYMRVYVYVHIHAHSFRALVVDFWDVKVNPLPSPEYAWLGEARWSPRWAGL